MFDDLNLLVWLFALALAIAGGALLFRRRLRRARHARLERALRPARPSQITHFPVVLAHGWMGFDAVALPGMRQEYFRGVRGALEADGHMVIVPRVSPVASIRRRAEQLAKQLDAIEAERVNIVAHSMGGLDARYAISEFGLAHRVASLTTLGTPHQGTPLADKSILLGHDSWAGALLVRLGIDFGGLSDLSTERMRDFNAQIGDAPSVFYASYRGWVAPGAGPVNRLLQPGYRFLNRSAGHNDGLVPASSQAWGEVLGDAQADHWAQIGWSPGFDARTFYVSLARELARRGL